MVGYPSDSLASCSFYRVYVYGEKQTNGPVSLKHRPISVLHHHTITL